MDNFIDTGKQTINTTNIYRSKIACVPTPGYSGHTSIFVKPISYLNKDKMLEEQKVGTSGVDLNGLSPAFTKILMEGQQVDTEVTFL
jgi:hypothetical protein